MNTENKRYILFFLSLFITIFRLSAQLSDPVIKCNRTWAYRFEVLEITVRTVGTNEKSTMQTKLIVEQGDIILRAEKKSTGSSYDYSTDTRTVFTEHKFKIVPLQSEKIVIKAIVQEIQIKSPHSENILESESIAIDIKQQPDILKSQGPYRGAINLHMLEPKIIQGEESILFIELFSDGWAVNLHTIISNSIETQGLKDFPFEILNIKNLNKKTLYIDGQSSNIFTIAVSFNPDTSGKYTIPAQKIEMKIRWRNPEKNGAQEIKSVILASNAIELNVSPSKPLSTSQN